MRLTDKLLACNRSLIKTIIDQIKNMTQIEHSGHCNPVNFVCRLIACFHQANKFLLYLESALPQWA
ncbi:transposase [Nostoc sp. CCY0012]|uniref:transposase n=1 Tax=Nostoc sp. CCY0012 TaxID=1056123 RepID=UPI0039C6D858